ncbi:LLM class F420-dependent oxidoreductase [Streptomyces sp. SID4956]|uniref:TIGR03619 family F420-dependent LLM class oxidoreductase n=1 Tax=Streptomyces sp. SID4956 TaxID=2690290 RepID=UPI00136B3921|nr:TIGR03619 family F420-dependent LLM class oxidoreductase [Streptomyces sp. SID4956]
MKFTVEYPISAPGYDPSLATGAGVTQVVRAIEECGFDAVAFTEHPAPSKKWLDAGGHDAFDLIGALSYCAAVTERLRLMTYLLVLPYRNPLLNAKSLATVDQLSGGRLTVVAGTGYLRSEFRSVGVDFDERNELFDEALEVMRGVWSQHPFSYEGRHFQAHDTAPLPRPVQPGGPPVWIGGNSALSRRRAARCQGWSPLMVTEELARTTRSPVIADIDRLATLIAEVREHAAVEQGPEVGLDFQVQTPASGLMATGGSEEEHREYLGRLRDAGVTSFVVRPPGDSIEAAVAALHTYADAFLAKNGHSPQVG